MITDAMVEAAARALAERWRVNAENWHYYETHAKAALEAADAAAWQPIETAPHNQRIVLQQNGSPPNDEIAIAWWDRSDDQFYYAPQGGVVPWTPTHWRPLPEPPQPRKD